MEAQATPIRTLPARPTPGGGRWKGEAPGALCRCFLSRGPTCNTESSTFENHAPSFHHSPLGHLLLLHSCRHWLIVFEIFCERFCPPSLPPRMHVFLTDRTRWEWKFAAGIPCRLLSVSSSAQLKKARCRDTSSAKQPFQFQFTFNLDNRVSIFALNVFVFGSYFRFRRRLVHDENEGEKKKKKKKENVVCH